MMLLIKFSKVFFFISIFLLISLVFSCFYFLLIFSGAFWVLFSVTPGI